MHKHILARSVGLALLASGLLAGCGDKGEAGQQGGVRAYNLASSERIVRGRMPTLQIINERLARNLRVGLGVKF